MNALETYLIQLIKTQGPISVAAFMAEALGNEKYGYYMKKDPFGQKGDFTTAPEISQMFGEIIGLWHAGNWLNMDSPDRIHLIEIGPGRGTLMQDALRAMAKIPGLPETLNIHLVEISPTLREIQQKSLESYRAAQWHDRIGDVLRHAKGEPVLIIANEFFDALPVRQFQKTAHGWHERLVGLEGHEKLALRLAPAPSPEQIIPPAFHRANSGAIVEICSMAEYIMEEIAEHISHYGGAALIIDYGYESFATGDSLQGVKHHKYINILQDPGDIDLTAHVNFHRLKEIAFSRNTRVYGPTGQGAFLKSLGIETRARTLLAGATDSQKEDILSARHRLTDPNEMGELFRVMAVTEAGLGGVGGFEEG